jgi:hypothetical protein
MNIIHEISRYLVFVVLLSAAGFSAAEQEDFPKINFYYLIPSDRDFQQEYLDGIEKAALSNQSFYSEQLGGAVYATTNPIVQVVYSANDTSWHADNMWSRAIDTVGGEFFDPNNIYIIYVDAQPSCTANNGIGGSSGIAVLGENDLRGLSGREILPDCNGNIDSQDENRWIGGLGHEMGHALGLHHPEGCDPYESSCDTGSIMAWGYISYPDTYFGSDDIANLYSSGFFTASYANPRDLPLTEDFESDLTWYDMGDFDWTVNNGSTFTANTGPSGAAQGENYLYFETSDGFAYDLGDEAVLESDVFAAQDAKISFQYHMYGSNIGTLAIEASGNGLNWETVWSASGQQQTSLTDAWTKQVVRLDDYSGNIKLRIRATAAGGYKGDIAIDNIKIHNGVEILYTSFDGEWFYNEWTPVSYADEYVQFVVGTSSDAHRWLYRFNSGATRGDYLYQYYHRNDICEALGEGTYTLSAEVWPEYLNELKGLSEAVGSITCD